MLAVITGATSGIGKKMSEYLYEKGWNLILTGRNREVLANLEKKYNGKAETIALDMSYENDVYRLYDFCKEKDVDMIVNNAGFGIFGEFEKTDLKKEIELINVNVKAVHILTKLFLQKFCKKNKGIILNVASSAGFLPGPLLSSYYASKNYVTSMTLAISEELRRKKSNVKICMLCPGPVDTEFNNRAGVVFSVKPISAEYAAKYAINQALKGKTIIIPGTMVRLGVVFSKFVPKKLLCRVTYNIQKKKMK
ncbi:MAG: SDR family oxidoreductase [Oscillospiraceae bacterium]|nr:SDR family oxidoreductase [Oscillospiraceae bacterium]MDD6086170.1 SDR family oxidoreductase [Oscillospiraceae bacterium]MDY3258181.1 SDR family oxidoreductase [Ruminococcus callidus]